MNKGVPARHGRFTSTNLSNEFSDEFDFGSIQSVPRQHLRHSSIKLLDSNHVDLNQSDGDGYIEFPLFISSVICESYGETHSILGMNKPILDFRVDNRSEFTKTLKHSDICFTTQVQVGSI